MYAQHSYTPKQPRSIGFGAAFAINGAIIAGIGLFLAPTFVAREKPHILEIENIPIQPDPPPRELPKPEPEPRANSNPLIVAPKPLIATEADATLPTTDSVPLDPPSRHVAEAVGPTVIAEPTPPPPPLPLIAARPDPRFAAAFQPDYPASELRAQRDGVVKVRVLIGTDGRVKAVEQLSATSPAFFEATRRQALGKWRFRPAMRGDVPQESWKTMNLSFLIKDQ